MGMLDAMAGRVADGETVQFRPTGSSMVPLIRSRDLVIVAGGSRARRGR
jgi:phage repressor protein C with HTH and peptisase S24 domain